MSIIKLNLGSGPRQLHGFVNLDRRNGWAFQDGLNYPDDSISAITISHALMYLIPEEISKFLNEVWRVLKVGAVIRITEDDTENPLSDTYKVGYKNIAKSLTGPIMMRKLLEDTGFEVWDVDENKSYYGDSSLLQNFHRGRPRCFFIEAMKL